MATTSLTAPAGSIAANRPGATTAQAAATAAARTTTGFGGDFQTFLKLLTTQLQNQDPTNAMSPEQMTSQLVQFAGVEQQIRMNGSLEQLIGLQQASQLTASAPLLGRRVELEGDRLPLQGGSATLRLPPAGLAAAAQIQVLDPSGRMLREARVPLGSDVTEWRWDGRNAAGQRLSDGGYRFAVTGTAANGGAAAVAATALGRVTGAQRVGGALQLSFGSMTAGFDQVRSLAGE
jgi:flagellar basal-body rod modification protein FlgD